MVNKENWEKLKRNQPPMYRDLKGSILKEYIFLRSSNSNPDENSQALFTWNHTVLETAKILTGFDTLLQDYETLLSM